MDDQQLSSDSNEPPELDIPRDDFDGRREQNVLSRPVQLTFVESPHSLFRKHRDHEPVRIPLNRPPGTFSPAGGEGWDEGVRFMER